MELRLKEPSDSGLAFKGLFLLMTTGLVPLLEKDLRKLLAQFWKPKSGGLGSGGGRLGPGLTSGSGFCGSSDVLSGRFILLVAPPEAENFPGVDNSQFSNFSFSDKESKRRFLELLESCSSRLAVLLSEIGSGHGALADEGSGIKCERYLGMFGISSLEGGVDLLSSIRGE